MASSVRYVVYYILNSEGPSPSVLFAADSLWLCSAHNRHSGQVQ